MKIFRARSKADYANSPGLLELIAFITVIGVFAVPYLIYKLMADFGDWLNSWRVK